MISIFFYCKTIVEWIDLNVLSPSKAHLGY